MGSVPRLMVVAGALLLLPCAASASLRLEGLGPNLAGIVDDQVTDLLGYPQLNALTSRWSAGFELLSSSYCYVYVRDPGPISVAGVLDASNWLSGVAGIPSVAVAASRGRWAFGAVVTVADFQGMRSAPFLWVPGDSSWSNEEGWWDVGNGNLGIRWSGDDVILDGTLSADLDRGVYWSLAPDTFVRIGDYHTDCVTPALRLTLGHGSVLWRINAAYEPTLYWDSIYDSLGGRFYSSHWTEHLLSAAAGSEYSPNRNVLAVAALQVRVRPQPHNWSWKLRLPAGLEWNQGPWTLRFGTEASVLLTNSGGLKAEFDRAAYFGLGIRPTPRLTLDFVPSMDDAANLRSWQLGATAEF